MVWTEAVESTQPTAWPVCAVVHTPSEAVVGSAVVRPTGYVEGVAFTWCLAKYHRTSVDGTQRSPSSAQAVPSDWVRAMAKVQG